MQIWEAYNILTLNEFVWYYTIVETFDDWLKIRIIKFGSTLSVLWNL